MSSKLKTDILCCGKTFQLESGPGTNCPICNTEYRLREEDGWRIYRVPHVAIDLTDPLSLTKLFTG